MKVLVVLCAVVAGCLAKPYVAYSAPASYSYSTSVVSVNRPAVIAAPAPLAYAAAPAPIAYAGAPAVVAAPAPVAYAAAPAPVAYAAAPAPVAYAAAPAVVAAPAPVAYAAPAPIVAPVTKSQYHAQNEIGQASYGHAEPGQTHNAVQDAYGNKVGSFSYVNPEGQVLRTDYVADAAGYRVASNALPAAPIVAPIDTPEVAAAKASFLSEYAAKAAHARRRRSAVLVQTPASTVPLPAQVAYAAPAPVAYAAAPAPVAYAAAPAPVAYAAPAPVAYAAPAPVAYAAGPAPVAYAAGPAPVAYAAGPAPAVAYSAPAPVAYSVPSPAVVAAPIAPAVRAATLTTVVNNPGHAVSYRVD